jgi:hypothetical protein
VMVSHLLPFLLNARCMAYLFSNLLFQYCFRGIEWTVVSLKSLNSFADTTRDKKVFSFYPDDQVCHGFEEVRSRYRELVPHVHLAG